jgi:mono/diheme cytochrome c family protein
VKAKDYYMQTVHPTLLAQCGACHTTGASGAPKFMAQDPATSYSTLDSYGGMIVSKETSKLPNHGAHTGPAMSAALKQVTDTWLDMEVAERGLKAGGPTLNQVMTQFGNCITEAEFESRTASGKAVADIPLIQTIQRGQCQTCHDSGGMDFWASNAQGGTQLDWQNNQKLPYLYKLITATPGANGAYTFTSDQNRIAAKQLAAQSCAIAGRRDCHPDIQVDLTPYMDALKAMTTEVAAKMAAGQCGPLPPAQ